MQSRGRLHLQPEASPVPISGISDPGQVSAVNEDAIYIDPTGRFMLLADGMGGHGHGAEASRMVLDVVRPFLHPEAIREKQRDITEVEGIPSVVTCLSALVGDAVDQANAMLFERNRQKPLHRRMGSTLVGLVRVATDYMLWFHVGDSRVYRWRQRALACLTTDHSAHQEWLKNGCHGDAPAKNVITRAVGPGALTFAEIAWDRQQPEDIYLLCSDGLTAMLDDTRIAAIVGSTAQTDAIVDRLVAAANQSGGKDNVSVIACRL